jgi:hypothetical protein
MNTLLPRTSLGMVNAASKVLTYGKLLHYIRMHLFMSSCPG